MYTLDEREAFEAMGCFLEAWYELGHADDSDLAIVLSSMESAADGGTHDPAAWYDWLDCVRQIVQRREEEEPRGMK